MQTLEEKRELLLKAVMGEVELEWLLTHVKGNEWCNLDINAVGKNSFFADGLEYEIDDFIFRIAEPRKTDKQWADDLAEAIEACEEDISVCPKGYRFVLAALDMAKRYRSQQDD